MQNRVATAVHSFTRLSPWLMALGLSACQSSATDYRLTATHASVVSEPIETRQLEFSGVASSPDAHIQLQVLRDENAPDEDRSWLTLDAFPVSARLTTERLAGLPPHAGSTGQLKTPLLSVALAGAAPRSYPWKATLALGNIPDLQTYWAPDGVGWFRILQDGIPLLEPGAEGSICDLEAALCEPSTERIGLVEPAPVVYSYSAWLSRGLQWYGSELLPDSRQASEAYYEAVEAAPGKPRYTLEGWKVENGFPDNDVQADYYNYADLGFGREMHCRALPATDAQGSTPAGLACYVTNYGDPSQSISSALSDLLARDNPVATVAMEYRPDDGLNPVRFYAYGAAGQRLTEVALDSQGPKSFPGLCISCHGGAFNPDSARITGANFLPFDVGLFRYADQKGKRLSDQQEAFRQLNALVLTTPVTDGIQNEINALYLDPSGESHLNTPGAQAATRYVLDAWQSAPVLYQEVIRPYCQGCHSALVGSLQFQSPDDVRARASGILSAVCDLKEMPHSELANRHFWESSARAHLLQALDSARACAP